MNWAIVAAFIALAPMARAGLVTYVDSKGVKHVVQSADEIPEKYRNKAKSVGKGEVDTGPKDKFTIPFCTKEMMLDRKVKLKDLGKEEAQLMANGDADTNPAVQEKLKAKREQMDEVTSDMNGCSRRYKKEEMF